MVGRNAYIAELFLAYENLYPTNHLFIFSTKNLFRKACVVLTSSKVFDWFIMLAIAANCVMMATNTPFINDDELSINYQIEAIEVYFLAVFCIEAFLKIISQGFLLHKYAYLRNIGNILDFVVVITGVLPYLGMSSAEQMKALQAARVLRPLKFISRVPSLQIVMSAISKSAASLLQIWILIGIVIVFYAIVGLSFFMGLFHQTCFNMTTNNIWKPNYLCLKMDSGGRQCPSGTVCKEYWSGPNYGITSFDNIFLGCVTVFVCMTCEGWTDTMYWTFHVYDAKSRFVWVYFYTLNVIGAQFMLNLVRGVLSSEFSKEKKRFKNQMKFKQHSEAAVLRATKNYETWVDVCETAFALLEQRLERWKDLGNEVAVESQLVAFKKLLVKRNLFIRTKIKLVMLSTFMYWLVAFLVFLNSLFGIIQHYKQPHWIDDVAAISDNFFLAFFFSEMCLKLYALGPTKYFKMNLYRFEFGVVVADFINLILSKFAGLNLGISVLRQLRLMRLFKLTRYWSFLKNLVSSILASMSSTISLLLLLFLFILTFALLGMELFGGQFKKAVGEPQTNFDDFFNAFLAVFQIITGEDWNYAMYEGIRSYGGPKNVKGLLSSLYYITVTVLGNYILLNVFLAIAVGNISWEADDKEQVTDEKAAREEHMKEIHEKYHPEVLKVKSFDNQDVETENKNIEGEFDSYPVKGGVAKPGQNFLENLKNPNRMIGNLQQTQLLEVKTLFIFQPTNPVRKVIHLIISSPYFETAILVLILASSSILMFEDVTDPNAPVNIIISYGVFLHTGSYCRDVWNCIDLFVVGCALVSIILCKNRSKSVNQVIKIFRILRVIRPFRSINKLPKLKAVFVCMIFSLKNVTMVLIIIFQFLVIFSIMGVQLFAGSFWYCTDPSIHFEDDCCGSFITYERNSYNSPIEIQREWKLYSYNFENVLESLITLFTSSTVDGWYINMQRGMDSRGPQQSPLKDNRVWVSIYFVIFIILFTFFFINIFIGIIILTFQEKGGTNAQQELDRNARSSLVFAMSSKPLKRFMPKDLRSLQYKAWKLIESDFWEIVIISMVFLNSIAMLIEFYDQPAAYNYVLQMIHSLFTIVFALEFAVKIFALHFNYFRDIWNIC